MQAERHTPFHGQVSKWMAGMLSHLYTFFSETFTDQKLLSYIILKQKQLVRSSDKIKRFVEDVA